ncbi:cold shock domain-containing protein [Streptomyces sp. NPDC003016]
MAERQSGTVKWFNDAKGFGFITPQGAVKRSGVTPNVLQPHHFGRHGSLALFDCQTVRRGRPRCPV